MILNNKLSIIYCLILLFLLILSILSKEIIYENLDDSDKEPSHETDAYRCMKRYNRLLEAYKDSLNNVSSLRENPNMDNSLFPLTEHAQNVAGVSTQDARKSANCPNTYSISDAHFFKNVSYDEHYINWLNISVLRHFGNISCNTTCSNFLKRNLNNDDSFDINNGISPSLVSLHHLGFYDSSSLNLPTVTTDDGDFEVYSLENSSLKEFYIETVRRLYQEYQAPRRIYFGVGLVNDVYIVWLALENGILGLNKLIQGCAILNGGSTAPMASILTNTNVVDLIYTPPDSTDNVNSINYIDPNYIHSLFQLLPTSDNVISVFGFFV